MRVGFKLTLTCGVQQPQAAEPPAAGLLDEDVELAGVGELEVPEELAEVLEAEVAAGAAGADPEPLEGLEAPDAPDAISEPVDAAEAAPSAAVTAGAGSLVLAPPPF